MGKGFDLLYDIVTVMISIADITTDIIVLLSFYYQSRIIFFIISLVILIIANMAYSAAFIIRYNVPDRWGICPMFLTFFISLPIASLFSFLFLFTEDETTNFAQWFNQKTNLKVQGGFENFFFSISNKERSKMVTWMIKVFSI